MNNSRMTLWQLVNAYPGLVYIQSLSDTRNAKLVELTNYLKGHSGLMSIEITRLYNLNGDEIVAVLDIPAEWLERMEG